MAVRVLSDFGQGAGADRAHQKDIFARGFESGPAPVQRSAIATDHEAECMTLHTASAAAHLSVEDRNAARLDLARDSLHVRGVKAAVDGQNRSLTSARQQAVVAGENRLDVLLMGYGGVHHVGVLGHLTR